MNFSVGICALFSVYGDLRNVRLYLYLCVSLFELQLPRWILLGRCQSISLTPLSIYLSLQVYSCDFSYFSFALLFRIRFSSYFTIYTLRLLVNSRHFRYIVFDFNAFYAFHITHTSFNLSFSIFHLFFLLFFCNFALLAKQFSHANFKWNRIQLLLLLLLSRRGARDRKVEATKNDDCRWRNWRGAYVARALNCVSILNVGPEPAKPNKCQSATLQRNSTTSVVFTGFLSALALALSCALSRALHW